MLLVEDESNDRGFSPLLLAASRRQQRIYVGGMDPIRGLTAQDVLGRLESRLQSSEIGLQDLHVGDCYIQFTAAAVDDEARTILFPSSSRGSTM